MKYNTKTLIILVLLTLFVVACEGYKTPYENQGDTQQEEARYTEENQTRLLEAHPLPEMRYSLERVNLIERLTRFNDPNKLSYIYLLSDTGQIYAFIPIKGKVSSVNSMLTTPDQIVDDPFGATGAVVSSPQEDGSYGDNGAAIFFFDVNGVYYEWNGKYLLADQPIQLTTQPLMIVEVGQ